MPDITICPACHSAHWSDRPCPVCLKQTTPKNLLEQAQAAFMEWIKMVEFELGTADGHFHAAEDAMRSGNLEAFGTSWGKAHGHLQNALNTIRTATKRGFEHTEGQSPQ